MAGPRSSSASERDKQLQEAFDSSAAGMDLRLEAAASPGEAVRTVGVAFCIINRMVDVELDPVAREASEDGAIKHLLHGYESLSPENFGRHWKEFAHDPHVGVGPQWLSLIGEDAVKHWLQTEELREALDLYPPFTPRKVTLEDLRIVYIGEGRAAATYRLVETHQNGKVTAGNVVAILMKLKEKGWRIMVASKGGRFATSGSAAEV